MDDEEEKRYKWLEENIKFFKNEIAKKEKELMGDRENIADRPQLCNCEGKATGITTKGGAFDVEEIYCARCDLRWPHYASVSSDCKAHRHNARLLKTFDCEAEGTKCERCKVRIYTNETRPKDCVAMKHIRPAERPVLDDLEVSTKILSDMAAAFPKPEVDTSNPAAKLSKMRMGKYDKAADDIMAEMAQTYRDRSAVYGHNFEMLSELIKILFPLGVPSELVVTQHWHLFELVLVKLSRFAVSHLRHIDSIHDAAVYSVIIEMIIRQDEVDAKRSKTEQ